MRRPEKPPPLPLNMPVLEAVQPQRPDRRRLFIELVQLHPQLSEPRGLQRQCTGTGRPGPPGIRKQLSASNESVSEDQSPHASSSSPPPAELGWVLTHHWNWAFAQEAMQDGNWRKPHLPTVSAKALVVLHQGLGVHNVLLDVEAANLSGAVGLMLNHLVQQKALPSAHRETAQQVPQRHSRPQSSNHSILQSSNHPIIARRPRSPPPASSRGPRPCYRALRPLPHRPPPAAHPPSSFGFSA